jgi:hypothetical protein
MIRPHHQVLLFGVLIAAACHGAAPRAELPPPAPALAPADTACLIAAGRPASRDTVAIALTEPVDPAHAPLPRNVAERFVFAQLYETLIHVDCQGRVLPALARSWEQGAAGGWTVTLRSDARFWDGAPVTARDVLAAWRARDSSLARAITILDDRALSIDPSGLSFQRFADPALAVTKSAPGGGWPIGTGRYWTTGAAEATDALWASPVPGAGLPALKVTVAAASEARDAVDANVDLLLTSDPAALEYGRTRSQYQDAPLEWDHTYVLLAPEGSGLDLGALRLESLPQAVHVEARAAQADDERLWFVDLKGCGLAVEAASTRAPPRRRIVYEQADRDARDLAARLVGLAALGRGAVVAGLAPPAFETAFRGGAEAAYVLRVRRRTVDPCAAARDLPAWLARGSITPLIDTRTHALVRRGLPRLSVDWDGAVRLVPR